MEQRVVLQEDNRYIYFISQSNYSFYMIIPRASSVSIVLEVMDGIDDIKVRDVKSFSDKVIVIPVLNSSFLTGIKQRSADAYSSLDGILSSVINFAHQILTYNKLVVSNVILLDENVEFSMFINWFVQKYAGRVMLTRLSPTVSTLDENVGGNNTASAITENQDEAGEMATTDKSMGFVSYVLLGVVVAVVSLVFLYLIL